MAHRGSSFQIPLRASQRERYHPSWKIFFLEWNTVVAYAPMSNSLAEVKLGPIKFGLRKFVVNKPKSWDATLAQALFV